MGLVYGTYGGRSDEFAPGAASYETGFCPHGGKLSIDAIQLALNTSST